MSVPNASLPRRSGSPKHYDFLPSKQSSNGSTPAGTAVDSPDVFVKTLVGHPPTTGDQLPRHHLPKTDSEDGDTDSEATNSSDEFDWDHEDDAASRIVVNEKKAKRGRRLWLMYTRLAPIFRVTFLAIIFGGLLATPAILFLLIFKTSPARPHVLTWSFWLSTTWVVSCGLSLVIDGVPRAILWLVFLVYGKAPEIFKTQVELFMAVSFWLKLALDVTAAWVSLSVTRGIINPPGRYWSTIDRIVRALFAVGTVLLIEKIFVRIIAIRFHQKALADRLHENRIALKALDKLSSATPAVSKKKQTARRRSPGPDGIFSGANSRNASPRTSRPATPELKTSGGVQSKDYAITEKDATIVEESGNNTKVHRKKKTKAVTTLLKDQLVDLKDAIGQVALKDSRFNRQGEIGSLYSARKLARNLFSTLSAVYPPRSHLLVQDFYPYFKSEADAQVAFSVFDQDDNGDISKKEMREAVQRIYRERKALIASLKDMSSAVAKLDAVMIGVALIIILFIGIFIFNPNDTLASLVPLATIVLGFSFVFGNSAKTIFESLIFIFSTHVYDVGDMIIVDDQVLTVKEFGLFATTFRRADGQEVVAPNSLLGTQKLIQNMRRSGSQWETTTLTIGYSTPMEIVEKLKMRLRQYMAEHNREWGSPGVEVWIDSMKFQNDLNLNIAMEHRRNWQDWGGRWGRRNLFMKHLRTVLEELEVTYSLPMRPLAIHPSSTAPPWLSELSGRNPLHGNSGFMHHDPIRNATAPSGIPSLNLPRF